MKAFKVEDLLREHVRSLEGYTCARGEFSGEGVTLMDANESPVETGYNRYPDPFQRELRRAIARVKGVDAGRVIVGNGSDELIDLLTRSTCEPGRDNMIAFSPSYSMYEVCGRVNAVETRVLPLGEDLEPRWDALREAVDGRTRLAFFCTPNNPTGNRWPLERLREVAGWFPGWLVVDEAYMDFVDGGASATGLIDEFPRVFVLQTLSKAWGLAGLRVGIGIGDPGLLAYLDRVKAPYNVSAPAQRLAVEALGDEEGFRRRVAWIVSERERLRAALAGLPFVERVYASEANFVLARCAGHEALHAYLLEGGVVTRRRHVPPLLERCLRFTVGTPAENDRLIDLLEKWKR
jgi:histidinol-phosphate aminotransferase